MNNVQVKSWVESAWNDRKEGFGFIPKRCERYHREAAVSFAEVVLTQRKMQGVRTQLPSEAFLSTAVDQIVLGAKRLPSNQQVPPCPNLDLKLPRKEINPTFVADTLNTFEHELIYKGYLNSLVDPENTIARKVYAILTDANLGNKINKENITPDAVEQFVTEADMERVPLMFILPSFPFKDQNPFNTNEVPPWHVDFGDVALLIRLHVLALALRQVLPFGCEVVILSDGQLYASHFDIPIDLARRYSTRLQYFRNFLNLQRSVHILDLHEACRLVPKFDDMVVAVTDRIEKLQGVTTIADATQRLTLSMIRNLGWRDATKEQQVSVWNLMHGAEPQNTFELNAMKRARKCAIDYLGINVTIKWLNVYESVFPHGTRCTVHPKMNQTAIPLWETLPWNGCGVLDTSEVNVCRFHELPSGTVAAYPDGWEYPFVYIAQTKTPS